MLTCRRNAKLQFIFSFRYQKSPYLKALAWYTRVTIFQLNHGSLAAANRGVAEYELSE
ncbi:hypothetical protein ECOT7509_4857 [Escherichia coli TW07509]|nr:hypothetical protein ECOT7509_4857 [Escherichia coli TW07509]